MNREQMIAWLTLEGWRYHPEDEQWQPTISNGVQGYPLHMRHEGYAWRVGDEAHKQAPLEEMPDAQLVIAARNLGVDYG